MKRILKWIGGLLLLLVLVGVAGFVHVWYFRPAKPDWFYGRVFFQFALENPELLSRLRILEPLGLRGHNARLSDASPAREDALLARLKRDLATLREYDRGAMSGQDALSYDIFEHFLDLQVRGERFRRHDFPVNQMFGVQSQLPNFMVQVHAIESARDARDYLSRLRAFPVRFEQVIEGLKLREAAGVLPPKFVVEKVLTQMRGFVAGGAEANLLYTHFDGKLKTLPVDDAERDTLRAEARAAVEQAVLPAYGALIAYFESLAPKAQRNDGAWSLPDGEAYYAHQIEVHTTTRRSAEEIHALGLTEVARIAAEMDAILRGQGLVEGSIGERVRTLAAAPEQLYPDDDAGRERILADYTAIIREIEAGLDPYFAVRPKAAIEVKRVPEFAQKTAPGAYYEAPALDGSRPGVFYANLRNVSEIPRFGMRTLAYHEAVPGHHFQIAIAQELKDLPIFRRMLPFTAYAEGWALYAERLAWEAGFQKNPLDDLGRLQAEMFRAVRLVVDTGLHAKRWTREQAIDYMLENTGMGADEVEAEIERYLVNPGQALAYKVGMLEILALRERARAALGDRFDLRAFHDQVLKNGSMPLSILGRVIDEWIASQGGAAATVTASSREAESAGG